MRCIGRDTVSISHDATYINQSQCIMGEMGQNLQSNIQYTHQYNLNGITYVCPSYAWIVLLSSHTSSHKSHRNVPCQGLLLPVWGTWVCASPDWTFVQKWPNSGDRARIYLGAPSDVV